MSCMERLHGGYVFQRRVRVLGAHLAELLPPGASVLDVGCGDGTIDARLMRARPDVSVQGIDVLVRPGAHIPVTAFDGRRIPHADGAFDVVMFVDVLHHTPDPSVLLAEAARVARRAVILKDHAQDGLLGRRTLRWMDRVGNQRHGVVLPYNYWPWRRWERAFADLGLVMQACVRRLGLYPWWADWLFGRRLHFIASLGKGNSQDLCESQDTRRAGCTHSTRQELSRDEADERDTT